MIMVSINQLASTISILLYGFLISTLFSQAIYHTILSPVIYIPVQIIFLVVNWYFIKTTTEV